MAERTLDVYESKLVDPSTDIKTKCSLLTELRDGIDSHCQGAGYPTFLQKMVPVLLGLLDGNPVFISTSPEQRLRNTTLEILHRIPTNMPDITDPYAPLIVDKCMGMVMAENEDNAVLCLKIIMDLERHHSKSCAEKVQPFLDLILDLFDTMEQTVKDTFDTHGQNSNGAGGASTPGASQSPRPGSPVTSASLAATVGDEQQTTRQLLKGTQSFKLVSECPIIVVSIFQAHRSLVNKNVKNFIPRIRSMLELQAQPQQRAHEEAHARGQRFTRIVKEIGANPQKRAAFGELVTAQVKTMSFLAYLMRVYHNLMQEFVPILPDMVVRLLQDLPREKSGARKELLVAIRHIVNYQFRTHFLPKLDDLLDERTLVGAGLCVYENHRFLAYTMLADLIHHVRDQLSLSQIEKTIQVYTKNLHDEDGSSNFHTMSAKLLFNMAESMAKVEDKRDARYYLMMVLNAVADKFATLNRQYPNAIKATARRAKESSETAENYSVDKDSPPEWDECDIFHATPVKLSDSRNADPVAENKFLFKNLVHGLKTIFYQLRMTNPDNIRNEMDVANVPSNWSEVSYGFNPEEVNILIKLFHEGAQVFRYYNREQAPDDGSAITPVELLANQHMMTSGKEEKDLLEGFASIFHHIDPATFYEVFQAEIPHLYDMIYDHAALLHIPQFLLASEATSPAFCGLLLQFLMGKIEEVGTSDVQKSSVILRLFKLSFMAVTLFSAQNEQVLLPHAVKLITKSIELSVHAGDPINYFLLLRSLFRSIGGGRFEHLYKEILPLLEMLLEVLNNLLISARKPNERDFYLMRPLVVALRAGPELVSQGLRTLELCVDNLTADYLDPIVAPVIDELMSALWDHLKPQPYNHFHSHNTMRILGKLGGRNRKFLTSPPKLDYRPYADDEASFDIRLIGSSRERAFPTRLGYEVAIDKIMEHPKTNSAKASDVFHKQQALNLIKAQVKLHIGRDHLPEDFAQLVRLQAEDLYTKKFDVGPDTMSFSEREKSAAKCEAQQTMLLKMIKSLMFATSVPELKDEVRPFLDDLYRHFTFLEFGRALAIEKHKSRLFDPNTGEGAVYIDNKIMATAITDTLSSDSAAVRDEAGVAMGAIWRHAAAIFGNEDHVDALPFFHHLLVCFTHSCYEEEWFTKSGGVAGISFMITELGFSDGWLRDRQLEVIAALLFVMKDMPQDLPATVRIATHDLLQVVVRNCNQGLPLTDLPISSTQLHKVCSRLVSEVSHMNKHVRRAAQSALQLMADALDVQMWEIVKPVKEVLLGPIYNKPLRALPFAVQIGYIDALTFCLDMENDVLSFEEHLNRSLLETLALVDADDESLAPKPTEYRSAESIVNLRVACLKLLTTALRMPGFHTSPHAQHRGRITAVFFRSLYSKNAEVADAANDGLKVVLNGNQKLPKDLLQSGLRPILMNVQDPRKLSVEGLGGLRTLLQLLTNYFKVEIGSRLLDHMNQIADTASLQKISFSLIEQNTKIKVITAIFSVFHLLPAAAVGFLGTLVERVLDVEKNLRRTQFSPFREPLISYLNHYPAESWAYFAQNLKDEAKGRFFAQILYDENSGPLRSKVVENDAFVDSLNATMSDLEKHQAQVNAIHVAHAICKFPETQQWLVEKEKVRTALFDAAKELQSKVYPRSVPSTLCLAIEQAEERIIDIFTNYLSQAENDIDLLFDILQACTDEQLKTAPALRNFIYKHIITSQSVEYRRSIAVRCIDVYTSKQLSPYLKRYVFRFVLSPMLAMDVQRNWNHLFVEGNKGTELLDKSLIEIIHTKLWKPQSAADISDEPALPGMDHCRMELIQFTAFMLKYHHAMLSDCRKDVIMFGWLYIRLEDVINKYAAYCLIAYFIANYDTPSKIAIQVYGKLLGAHLAEGRALVMQSLEILQPVLKKRIGDQNTRFPTWARIPRKILSEETSNLQQLQCIYQFMVRHPDMFFEARESFASIIIPSIAKVCQLPNPSSEGKKLALNLVTMIWKWEERAATETTDDTADRTFVASYALRMMLVKYMVQFIAAIAERYPVSGSVDAADRHPEQNSPDTIKRVVEILFRLLSPGFWSDLDIDSMYPKVTEHVLCSDPKQDEKIEIWTTRTINTLQLVRVFVNAKSDEWVVARLPQLQKLLAKPLKSEVQEIQHSLHASITSEPEIPGFKPIMQRIVEAIPLNRQEEDLPDADDPAEEFSTFLSTTAGDGLGAGAHVSSINILWTMSQRKAESIDTHIPGLLKALQTKLAKDHLTPNIPGQTPSQGPAPQAQLGPTEIDITVVLIIKVIEMLSARISTLGEQRRPYLSVLASLVERSQNNALCEKILSMVNDWIFVSTEPVPTLKEKTAVLQKMLMFEGRPDPTLYEKFLDLVIRIYEDPKILRSELAVRMEHAFLIGLRCSDIPMRTRFMTIFDKSLSRTTANRFYKLISEQQWDILADSFWLNQIIHLMFGSIDMNTPARLHADDFRVMPASKTFGTYANNERLGSVMLDEEFEALVTQQKRFTQELGEVRSRDILEPLANLQHTDSQLAHDIWVTYFPMVWATLSREDREDIETGLINLLTKDFHNRQIDKRPNCVQSLLEGIAKAKPRLKFPPHVIKFQAKNFDAWYIAATHLEEAAIKPIVDGASLRESNLDALVEIYASLQEDDLFYGTWRRRCQFVETNAALSYEQNGVWEKAQQMYEQAQIKARTGSLAFSQGEYMLWEDHWVYCAEKLQQWEILGDFAKHENLNDLFLEATWRNFEAWTGQENQNQLDTIIKAVSDAPTPRRMFFGAFMSLLRLHTKQETQQEFNRACDENIQLSIKQWHKLPKGITKAHISLLQNFQSIVELHDASVICASLAQTNAQNLDVKSQELKLLLATWRDRLPNFWDDINAWQDLVTWRQHVFHLINGVYLNLIPTGQGQNNASSQSFAYRGYHETAWIINRFAHVARKHQMPDVCINQLSRIYTLPNIEIQEAFLKLREQAKCHYQNRSELTSGLDVINNTNLNYFGQQQKAEFYTLKGMFLAKLNHKEEANDAFGTALFFDIKLPKAWSEWGRYNDMLFKEDPQSMDKAANAISCYLEAAGQYKSAKSRKLLSRILWLLSLDDADNTLAKAWEQFKGETPVWYWVTFIPQLINNLSRTPKEAEIAHTLLSKLARTYPQALYFQLRTSREDMHTIKRSQEMKQQREKQAKAAKDAADKKKTESPASKPENAANDQAQPANGETSQQTNGTPAATPAPASSTGQDTRTDGQNQGQASGQNGGQATAQNQAPAQGQDGQANSEPAEPKKPWDHTEELAQSLKTAFPLLALSMETMVDQIQKYFKCQPDEDAYRLIVALLNDGLSYVGRYPQSYAQGVNLPPSTEANITRFSESILPAHIRKSFEADFVTKKPTMHDYINKLRKWRDRFEERLDRRSNKMHLEQTSTLAEFRYVKFDEVEVPGQYLQHRDKNQDFVRIERFMPDADLVRQVNGCFRRLRIRGHDGSIHAFAVQHPAARSSRREERILQLFRIFNSTLAKKKESRRRNLQFHLPIMVPLSPNFRMVQDDASYISLQAIYEDYCRRNGINRDEPTLFTIEKMRSLSPQKAEHAAAIRLEAFAAIQDKYVPSTVVYDYFRSIFPSFDALWLFRKQFSSQLAALSFLTFTMHMTTRYPAKMTISRGSGNIWGSELIPQMAAAKPLFHNPESVPFRLTPNLQTLMGPIHTEGIFVCALMAIARCLTDSSSASSTMPTPNPGNANGAAEVGPASDLEAQLSIFIRDEMMFWFTSQHRQGLKDGELRDTVQKNADAIVNKALVIAGDPRANNLPASQSVLDLVARATEPRNLSACDPLWMAYL
ncbi:hypothetical protein MBLNU457_g0953t2 [Dothideomycetes sp. NU457]